MSRTAGVTLPRLPTSHARVTSPTSIQPQSGRQETEHHRRAFSEPNYTAYIGTPRQDVPPHVYRDAAMFDDVFDKKGKLLTCRNTPKISSPLHSLEYNSLHDPHCRKLFLNNKKLRTHLTNLGLITNDLRVVANTQEQRQKIRSHELLERKEQLIQRLEDREQQRLERFQRQVPMPKQYQQSLERDEERRVRAQRVRQLKLEKVLQTEKEKQQTVERKREDYRQRLQEAVEEARLMEQSKRNTARAKQEMTEIVAYERQYGKFGQKLANWHRDSDRIHNRMVIMEHKHWSKARNKTWLSKSYPPPPRHSPESSVEVVESVPQLPPILVPQSGSDTPQREAAVTTGQDLQRQSKSTERETATQHHPTPVPPGDTEQKETQPDEQTPAEQKATLQEEKETQPLSESKEPDEMPKPKEVTAFLEDKGQEDKGQEDKGQEDKGHVLKTRDEGKGVLVKDVRGEEVEVEGVAAPPLQQVVVLNPEQSAQELVSILIDELQKLDYRRTGFLHTDDLVQVLNSRDLGLQLDENELLYVANQVDVYGNGWVPFIHVAPLLPNLLLTIYTQRAEQAIQQYGAYTEEQWCQLYPSSGGICYFNKLTGVLQYGRPDDFRPFLKDDVFEDSIVDLFETADANKDGVLEYNDFYTLLVSPMVSTRIYSNQMEQLLQLYQAYAVGGRMGLEEFSPVARGLLLMIYQNAYPDVEEWIQLDSRKVGAFWFNKISGETFVPPESSAAEAEVGYQLHTGQPIQQGLESRQDWEEPEEGKQLPKARKRKKHSKAKRTTPEDADAQRPPSQGPPPLRRRSSKSRDSTRDEDSSKEQLSQSAEPSEKRNEVEIERSENTVETVTTVPKTEDEVERSVRQTPFGTQRFETILEEDEEEEDTLEHSQQIETEMTEGGQGSGGGEVAVSTSVDMPKNGSEQSKDDHHLDDKQSDPEHHTIQDTLSASHSNHEHAQEHQGGSE